MNWMIQPTAASDALADSSLTKLGFWPRFLLAWPEEAPPRKAEQFQPELLPAVAAYWDRCNELLGKRLPQDADQEPLIKLDVDARKILASAFERFELQGRRGRLHLVKPFALRASEQAARIAGVLAAFKGAVTVDLASMQGALSLVGHSLDSWCALTEEGVSGEAGMRALRLYEWLLAREGQCETLSVVLNRGPSVVRTKDSRDEALQVLREVGLVATAERKAFALFPHEGVHHAD